MNTSGPVVLYDGICGLCTRCVLFLLRRDRKKVLRFASLQSEIGQDLMDQRGLGNLDLSTMALIEGERAYIRSKAALRVLKLLGAPWSFLYPLILVPLPIRDRAYALLAGHRYEWFGRLDTCEVPDAGAEDRFLDNPKPTRVQH